MSTKLKALSLGLLALLAMAAFGGVNTSAAIKGHFESEADHTVIVGTENGKKPHDLEFKEEGSAGAGITCTHAHYDGDIFAKTVTSVTVEPEYTKCGTTSDGIWGNVTVTTNGCAFVLYSHGANKHGTVDIECPAGKTIEIHHPNCTITVPAQPATLGTLTGGLTYDTAVAVDGKHILTPTVTIQSITSHYHAGVCVFLGTPQAFEMNGSLTVEGFNTSGSRVNITHT